MPEKKLIVAIDGPSGAGKSSVTKALTGLLGYIHIDTGAMFRTVALLAERMEIDPSDHAALEKLCAATDITFSFTDGVSEVLANGENVSAAIRTPEISLLTAKIAAVPVVREALLKMQRRMGAQGGVVMEGRDIGTVVFPDADVKFYLTASHGERGRRRFLELQAKGADVTLEDTIREVVERDEQDRNRVTAPLRMADDAIEIDSTGISFDEVVAKMAEIVKNHVAAGDL